MLELNKIFCGSCSDVLKTFPDECVDCCITSPPYPGVNNMWGDLYKADNFEQAHIFLSQVWVECLRVLRPGCKLIINIANTKRRPYLPNVSKLYQTIKAEPLGEIIWHKGYGQNSTAWGSYCNPSDPSLADQHEYIVVFRKYGERNKETGYHLSAKHFKSWRNSIWQIPPAKVADTGHCAAFPAEIPKRLILLYSYEGEIILDPFVGSGTTCAAAKFLNRQYIGIENNSAYFEIAEARLRNTEENLFVKRG